MAELDLQLAIVAASLGLAFVGSPLIDRFLKGPAGTPPNDGHVRQTWWLFFLAIWFGADAIVGLRVGLMSFNGFDAWPSAFLVGGLLLLLVSVALSLRPDGPAGSGATEGG